MNNMSDFIKFGDIDIINDLISKHENNNLFLGYKALNSDLTNRYNKKYELFKTYHADGTIKFGNNGNGFHMCTNVEDTLRYVNTFSEDISICMIAGWGKYSEYNDDYYGYYDMYAYEYMQIIKILSKEDVLELATNMPFYRLLRFLRDYKLEPSELEYLKKLYIDNQYILKRLEENENRNYFYNMKLERIKKLDK